MGTPWQHDENKGTKKKKKKEKKMWTVPECML
jgi:hypothetical protein